ncbi:MAG TPA: response regulator [Planctomycetota bacterium]|nr:response regulator [Planctomycetota bacterium]
MTPVQEPGPPEIRRPIVVVVDDDPAVLSAIRRLLREEPLEVLATPRAEEALEWIQSRRVSLVVADERMADMRGLQLLEEVERLSPSTGRILLTGYPEQSVKRETLEKGVFHLFYKPWNDHTLRRAIRRLAEVR